MHNDVIRGDVLKPATVPVITKLFNLIISEKRVSARFKTGIISSVLKKG